MKDQKNYIVFYFNESFHSKELSQKEAIIRDLFSKLNSNRNDQIKEIVFNTKNKPMAYVYFNGEGLAQKLVDLFWTEIRQIPNQYEFKAKLGKIKINTPIKPSHDERMGYPRSIIIDGNNVALHHGGGKVFSSQGLKQAVKFFEDRGHIDVKVIVPENRLMRSRSDVFVQDPKILQDLKEKGILETVKDDLYDDKNILTNAVHSFAVIISNDKFKDDQFKEMPEILNYLKGDNVLPFTFNGSGELLLSDYRLNCSAEYVLTRPKNIEKTRENSSENSFKSLLNNQEKKLKYSDVAAIKPQNSNLNEISNDNGNNNLKISSEFKEIYIRYMPKDYDELKIQKLFQKFGKIFNVRVFKDQNRNPTGCCSVEFKESDAARKAINDMNKLKINNSNLKIEPYRHLHSRMRNSIETNSDSSSDISSTSRDASANRDATCSDETSKNKTKLFIGNIDRCCDKQKLKKEFEKYGKVQEADIGGRYFEIFGLVIYKEPSAAQLAIEKLNGEQIDGLSAPQKYLKVDYFQKKAEL